VNKVGRFEQSSSAGIDRYNHSVDTSHRGLIGNE
jgi:hypothetical protein